MCIHNGDLRACFLNLISRLILFITKLYPFGLGLTSSAALNYLFAGLLFVLYTKNNFLSYFRFTGIGKPCCLCHFS